MKYIIVLLFTCNTLANCDLARGTDERISMCYYEPLMYVKCELMDEFRSRKYKGSLWVTDPRTFDIPTKFYMMTILDNGKVKYDD